MKTLILIACLISVTTSSDGNPAHNESRQDDMDNCTSQRRGHFTFYDYSVVFVMLIISLKIGVFYGFFAKPTDMLGGSGMSVAPVTMSLASSFITAIELLGNPAEIYFYGAQFALIVISMMLVIPVAVNIFYPIYHELQLTSCYEYLGVRFGREMRIMGGVLYIIQMSFYTSVSVLAPAIALSKATGINTRVAIILIYIVCVFYSSQGGLKAVVIADTFQTSVFLVSMVLIVILGTQNNENGFAGVLQAAERNYRLDVTNFNIHPHERHSVFSVIIGGFFYWTSLLCVNQSTAQKAMSLKGLSKAKKALIISVIGLVIITLMNFYIGLMVFAHYEHCDPMMANSIDEIDQLIPFYVMDTFSHIKFFVGLFVAGIFAASLGTVGACLSSLSSVTIEDLLIAGFGMEISSQKRASYAKWLSVAYGFFSFGLIFLVEGQGVLQATLTLNGLVGGVLLGLFSLGIFFKHANVKGAFYGGLLSIVCVAIIGIASQVENIDTPFLHSSIDKCDCVSNSSQSESQSQSDLDHIYQIVEEFVEDGWFQSIVKVSYMYYSMIGTLLTVFFGLVFSKISDIFVRQQKLNVKTIHDVNKAFNPHITSVTLATGRKLSSFIHHIARDVSNSTMRVEEYIKDVMSHTNLHLPHLNSDLDRHSILHESDDSDSEVADTLELKPDGKMFFIGHPDEERIERRGSLSENLLHRSSNSPRPYYH